MCEADIRRGRGLWSGMDPPNFNSQPNTGVRMEGTAPLSWLSFSQGILPEMGKLRLKGDE